MNFSPSYQHLRAFKESLQALDQVSRLLPLDLRHW
jgi:hypothetical protein